MALAIDGTVSILSVDPSGSSGNATLILSTSLPNDVIFVQAVTDDVFTGIVDTAGLTWNVLGGDAADLVWWAKSAAVLTNVSITIGCGAATFFSGVAFGVSGANFASPFDPNGSLPGIYYPRGTLPDFTNGTITTSNNKDMLLGFYISGLGGMSATGGWTAIGAASFNLAEWLLVSSVQTNTVVSANVGDSVGLVTTALVEAPTSDSHIAGLFSAEW